MNYYFAPLEGITGYIYRNAHHAYFNNVDKYFSPFISANQSGSFKTREFNDILPENNQGLVLVPQLLTNNVQDFINTANKIKILGYNEVNLNLGCPSGTVVSKNKGSGFLAKTIELDMFLNEIFSHSTIKISIKTRIGKDSPEEFYHLIEIFNRYPIDELIIHPRIQKDYYKNKPNLAVFKDALMLSKNPVCYNGDIFTVNDINTFTTNFSDVNSVMLGRGIIANPALVRGIKCNVKLDKYLLKEFHDKIYSDYKQILFGDVNILYKMKSIWTYMISSFSNNDKYEKKIKKSTRLSDYEDAVTSLFCEQMVINECT